LELDKDCPDARADIELVRLARLMDMGFPRKASKMALAEHSTVQVSSLTCHPPEDIEIAPKI